MTTHTDQGFSGDPLSGDADDDTPGDSNQAQNYIHVRIQRMCGYRPNLYSNPLAGTTSDMLSNRAQRSENLDDGPGSP